MRIAFLAASGLIALSACALGPKPCTAEWVDWKTGQMVNRFAFDHRKQIDAVRDLGVIVREGRNDTSTQGALRLALAAAGGLSLIAEFARDVAPEARRAMSECSTAPRSAQLFASMLRRSGVDERTVRAIEDLGVLLDMDR